MPGQSLAAVSILVDGEDGCSAEISRKYRAKGYSSMRALIFSSVEEASNFCIELQEQTVKAIEDWKDLVPEADLTTLVGEISARATELQEARERLERERERASAAEEREQRVLEQKIAVEAQAAARLRNEVERLTAQLAGVAEGRVAVGSGGLTVRLRDLLRGDTGGKLTLGDAVSVSGGSGGGETLTLSVPPRPATARTAPAGASSPEVKPPVSGKPSR